MTAHQVQGKNICGTEVSGTVKSKVGRVIVQGSVEIVSENGNIIIELKGAEVDHIVVSAIL